MPAADPSRPLDLGQYTGRWVALIAGRIVGHGRTPLEARRSVRCPASAGQLEVAYVADSTEPQLQIELPLSPVMSLVRQVLKRQTSAAVYLVGGAVRDALLGRTNKDLDLAVAEDAIDLARAVADELRGAFYILDAERGTARTLLQDRSITSGAEPVVIDFALLRGADLYADLADRDFTVNAMALPAALDSPSIDAIIDPFNGHADLTDRIVRAVRPDSIRRDPVRSMRAVRHAAALEGRIEPQTIDQIRSAADLLPTVSVERIRDELFRLLLSPQPADSIRTLDQLALLQHVLPELVATHGATQSPPHTLDVFCHTVRVLGQLDSFLAALFQSEAETTSLLAYARDRLARVAQHLKQHILQPAAGGRTRWAILYFAALLHDIGKPPVRTVEESGRIRFLRHEQVGAEMAVKRARFLALSVDECRMIATLVRHHMRPAWLAPSPSRRAVYRFFRDTGDAGVETCLLSLGDGLGRGENIGMREWEEWVSGIAILLENYFGHYDECVSPPALVTGRELIDTLHIPPGPEVGRLLELIREAQAAGEVHTSEGALLLAQEAHKSR
jgi:poly(A) polymerase